MTSFQGTVDIFNATDVLGFTAHMNEWGGSLKTAVSELRNAILTQGSQTEAATAELRGAVLMQAGELTTLRNGLS